MSSRYMFYVSYMGTRFVGSQLQKNSPAVQNVFNNALALVLNVPSSEIKSIGSSRTDAGVHAMRNVYGLDMSEQFIQMSRPRKEFNITTKQPYDPGELTLAMNHVLNNLHVDARVVGGRIVSNGFCCRRHTASRTYLYRLAVMKPEYNRHEDNDDIWAPSCFAPLIEKDRSWIVGSNFNYETFMESSKMFAGLHDFSCFTVRSKDDHFITPVRIINYCCVDVGRPLMDPKFEPMSDCFNFIDITINSKAFLFRQIRKMVGTMVAVAKGLITLDDVRWLFEHPSNINWIKYNDLIKLAPAHGLYLQDVDYNSKDFVNPVPYHGTFITEDDEDALDVQVESMPKKLLSQLDELS